MNRKRCQKLINTVKSHNQRKAFITEVGEESIIDEVFYECIRRRRQPTSERSILIDSLESYGRRHPVFKVG